MQSWSPMHSTKEVSEGQCVTEAFLVNLQAGAFHQHFSIEFYLVFPTSHKLVLSFCNSCIWSCSTLNNHWTTDTCIQERQHGMKITSAMQILCQDGKMEWEEFFQTGDWTLSNSELPLHLPLPPSSVPPSFSPYACNITSCLEAMCLCLCLHSHSSSNPFFTHRVWLGEANFWSRRNQPGKNHENRQQSIVLFCSYSNLCSIAVLEYRSPSREKRPV